MFVLVSFPFVDLNARAVSCVAGVIIKSPSVVGLFLDCPGILSQLLAAFAFSVPRGAVCPTEVCAASFHYPFILCLLTYVYGHYIQSMGPGPVDARVTESWNCTRASVIGSLGGLRA